jgi:flagellar biogenesis protein FliO
MRLFALRLLAIAWVAAAANARAAAPGLGGGEALGVSLGRVVTALIICLMIAVLAALLIRQRAGKGDLPALMARLNTASREIQVVETRRLSPHADICIVRHDDREYLLLLQSGHGSVLRERPAPAVPAVEA